MELDEYVDRLRTEFTSISDVASDEVRDLAERLAGPLESAVRLVLLDALAAAADEITLDMVPGSVHLRLRGSSPDFVVTAAPASGPTPSDAAPPATVAPHVAPVAPVAPSMPSSAPGHADADNGAVARINFRPPESLKVRIEEAAGRDGLSVNTWLTRVATAALDPQAHPGAPGPGRNRAGWFG